MTLITALILILGVIIIYTLFVNLYTILFQITGLPKGKCKFQVISLLTNCGYTTKESEMMMTTPARRRIALANMLTGNIFSVLLMSLFINLVSSFSMAELSQSYIYLIIVFVAFILVVIFNNLPFTQKLFAKNVSKFHHLIHKDKINNDIMVIDTYGKDVICEIDIHVLPLAFVDTLLKEVFGQLPIKFNILMIVRNSKNIKVNGDTIVQPQDHIIVFGTFKELNDLFVNGDLKDYYTIDSHDNIFEIVSTNGNNAIVNVTLNTVPEALQNKTLFEMNLTNNGLNILYITNNDESVQANKYTTFTGGEIITVFGNYQHIKNTFSVVKNVK